MNFQQVIRVEIPLYKIRIIFQFLNADVRRRINLLNDFLLLFVIHCFTILPTVI